MLFELFQLQPLFPGKDELDQLNKIFAVLGTPSHELMSKLRHGAVNNPIQRKFAPVKGVGIKALSSSMRSDMADLIERML